MFVSSVGQRNITHILFLDTKQRICRSLLIQITHNLKNFNLNVDGKIRFRDYGTATANNSLIRCHAEVWERFPVRATIQREIKEVEAHHRSIIFVSSSNSAQFVPYFSSLIRRLEKKSSKPTGNLLQAIKITCSTQWDPKSNDIAISAFQTGEWLMAVFCLIPIQVARTDCNRLIPLKDGISGLQLDQELLGAGINDMCKA